MSQFANLIKEAKKPANREGEAEKKEPSKKKAVKEIDDISVNLTIKVSQSLRRHWAAEAKRSGITITDVIIEALKKKFGTPENAAQ